MQSITTWVSLLVQLISIAAMIWWNAKKQDWAKNDSEKAKAKDRAETENQNQSAQEQLDSAESANNADREEILKG